MSTCPNLYSATLKAPGTQPLAMLLCGFFLGSNRNHYLPPRLLMRPLATFMSMYVRVPTPKPKTKMYFDTQRNTVGIIFTVNITSSGTKYDAVSKIMS